MEDKRRHKRVEISFPVECKTIPSRSYFYTVSKDLSIAGARILSNKFIPKGNSLKVDVNLIDKVLNLQAKVAWCNKDRSAERYLTGLEFINVNGLEQKALSAFLEKAYNA